MDKLSLLKVHKVLFISIFAYIPASTLLLLYLYFASTLLLLIIYYSSTHLHNRKKVR